MQDSLPDGWLAFTGRESNPLDRYERFPSCYISSPFPGFILTLSVHDPEQTYSDADFAVRWLKAAATSYVMIVPMLMVVIPPIQRFVMRQAGLPTR